MQKIIGRGSTSYDASYDIPKKDTQAEIARIDSDMAVYVNKMKQCKELIELDFIEEDIAFYADKIKRGKTLEELALVEKKLAMHADDINQCKALVELPLIESAMAVCVNDIKLGKALIDQIDAFPDGTFLVISEEDNQRLADQRDYERHDGWQKESLSGFVKGQYSGAQRRLRGMKKKHKELREMYDAPK